ncbi:MAG: hypothetical protein RRA94_10020, partial [Bacteroidota bacterium]|nr:hypothetical protein [Bacteroidota bacterium]
MEGCLRSLGSDRAQNQVSTGWCSGEKAVFVTAKCEKNKQIPRPEFFFSGQKKLRSWVRLNPRLRRPSTGNPAVSGQKKPPGKFRTPGNADTGGNADFRTCRMTVVPYADDASIQGKAVFL